MVEGNVIKILIVEDHQIIRIGLRLLLEKMENFSIVGEAEDGNLALGKALELRPDVILMDIGLRDGTGYECWEKLQASNPQVKLIFMSGSCEDE